MNMLAKGALCAAAAAMTLGGMALPTVASAQDGYYDGRGYHYDPCRRDTTQRGTTGALVGGGLGAVVGSNIAGRGVRTEGAVLGGLLGAAIGAGVGRESAACAPGHVPPPPPPPEASYGYGHYDRYGSGYGPSYEYDAQPYQGSYGYDYDNQGYAYSVTDAPAGADGCTLAESPIYLPDGRVQKRFVRVCRDASGRYQVVD